VPTPLAGLVAEVDATAVVDDEPVLMTAGLVADDVAPSVAVDAVDEPPPPHAPKRAAMANAQQSRALRRVSRFLKSVSQTFMSQRACVPLAGPAVEARSFAGARGASGPVFGDGTKDSSLP